MMPIFSILFFSLTYGDWNQLFFDLKNLLFHFLAKSHQLIATHWKPNIEIWRLFLFFSQLWRLKPTVSRFKFFLISLFGEISSADGYTLKTQYRNLAIFPLFFLTCGDWNQLLTNVYTDIFISLFGEITPADGYTRKTQYRNLAIFPFFFLTCGDWNQLFWNISLFGEISPDLGGNEYEMGAIVTGEPIPGYTLKTQYRNPAIFSFFFFSLVAIETNFCRIFFIFYISLFGEISPGKEALPLLPKYGPISRLSSHV